MRALDPEFAGTQRFQVMRRIGHGGMGVVYEVLDRDRRARCALKLLRTREVDAIHRFKREFQTFHDLSHDNLISLGELYCEEGQWFFTMELVDGVDFLDWVRPIRPRERVEEPQLDFGEATTGVRWRAGMADHGPPLDAERLRSSLRQLAAGLCALHNAGKVHRDVKPSNVLVERDGRVVLLDFGLATEQLGTHSFTDGHVVGTVDYMAPEQAAARRVGPEADWYAVGAVLYEALTERVPFAGPPIDVMMDKQRFEPPPPRQVRPEVPADLDKLCSDLLRFEPTARPSGAEVLRRLGAAVPREISDRPSGLMRLQPFVGRTRELGAIQDGFTSSREHAVLLTVEGQSGVGKTALMRTYAERLADEEPSAVVLSGRCYERETAPYKAFDGILDQLSRWLQRLPAGEVAQYLPLKIPLLMQVFPVLRRVETIAQAPRPADGMTGVDPQEQRRRVFQVIGELLHRIAQRRPLVLCIDDLQWADPDSVALLGQILALDDAPPLLLVATLRDVTLDSRLAVGDHRRLELGLLPIDDARALAVELMETARPGGPTERALAIAEEANGHPLFIDELVRHAMEEGAPAQIDLEAALSARVQKLDAEARALVELAAVAAAPLHKDVLARAASVSPSELPRLLAVLRLQHLLRSGGDRVESYHDRVREAVLAQLDCDAQRRWHERLALALEAQSPPDLEALAVHWRDAGQPAKAADYAAEAAAAAANALAFAQAVRLLRMALDLDPKCAQLGKRRAQLGTVLQAAGRGGEAARAFLSAAEIASPAEALELRGKAGGEYLRSGHIDEGLAVMREVALALGLKLPASPRAALASLVMRRLRLGLRGLGWKERDPSLMAPRELQQLDIHWSLAVGLGLVDNVRGADFQSRHLLLALDTGEPYRVSRALAAEACFHATRGAHSIPRVDLLIQRAAEIARRIDSPHAFGFAIGAAGLASYLRGDFQRSLELCDQGERVLRDRCTGVAWEMNTISLFALSSLYWLGDVDELARRVPRRLREAEERGDRYAVANFQIGYCALAILLRDGVEAARRAVEGALVDWSRTGYHLQHWYQLLARVELELHSGDPMRAMALLDDGWIQARRALLSRIQFARVAYHDLYVRAAVAATRAGNRAHLATLRRHAAELAREKMPFVPGLVELYRAAACELEGDVQNGAAGYDRAARLFEERKLLLHLACVRRREGLLKGDATLIAAADAWFAGKGVKDPAAMAALVAP
jgi:serine/threonine protein kinase